MKNSLLLLVLILPISALSEFIHPMDFDGSELQKEAIIKTIKDRVKKDYCESREKRDKEERGKKQ